MQEVNFKRVDNMSVQKNLESWRHLTNKIVTTSKCPEKLALANLIAVKNRSKCELCNQRTFISKCSEMRRNSLQSNIDFSRTFVNGSGHVTLTSSPLLSLGYNF